jgi:hypothetical protein
LLKVAHLYGVLVVCVAICCQHRLKHHV